LSRDLSARDIPLPYRSHIIVGMWRHYDVRRALRKATQALCHSRFGKRGRRAENRTDRSIFLARLNAALSGFGA
jgi:ribosomal protein L20